MVVNLLVNAEKNLAPLQSDYSTVRDAKLFPALARTRMQVGLENQLVICHSQTTKNPGSISQVRE